MCMKEKISMTHIEVWKMMNTMEINEDSEHHMMIEESSHESRQIDPGRARFPRCIVWAPLPVVSWFIPFIGHVGICREDGVILDFAGPNFVCVDNFAFGSATRYIQISKEKCSNTSIYDEEGENPRDEYGRGISPWDYALRKGTQEFQHLSYNLFTCNCHSFVANNLNRLGFRSGGWNVVNLATLVFLNGQWVSTGAIVRSILPFGVVFVLGLLFGGSTFLMVWAFFVILLIGWFLLGTYCFKDLIQL
ncbi:protein RTE1-HOMOLOG isoform X2 [Punica granatum]|uniref:Protein RTE1-HOMOLOG isoform X2 n=1 Tax=Punica granatum TaxID=22663 RepID=A0A6P8EBX9_PUNGR|nr:protein RTE1-HOMOLOG isoform X2 [Punica granatum]